MPAVDFPIVRPTEKLTYHQLVFESFGTAITLKKTPMHLIPINRLKMEHKELSCQ